MDQHFEHKIDLPWQVASDMRLWYLYIRLHWREKLGDMVSLSYKLTSFKDFYQIPDTSVPEMVEWLEHHCHDAYCCIVDGISFEEVVNNTNYEVISFKHGDDALMFKLTWL